jgi:hypothetical protein
MVSPGTSGPRGGKTVLSRLDHLVILTHDLERTAEDYESLGFQVTPGGEHADGLTRNALVSFRDGSYLELVSFIDPESDRDNVWGWRGFLPQEGLIDYCAASDGLGEDVERLQRLGFEVRGPSDGGRTLPDGQEIRWRSASIHQEGRTLPFLIEDLTPRETRVPGGSDTDHPNGATGIQRLEVSAPDPRQTAKNLADLTGTRSTGLALGDCGLVVAEGEWSGPAAVEFSTRSREGVGKLDPALAHGVRARLSPADG